LVEASMNADVLIHDSTLLDNLREKALEDGHSTARLAAEVAKKARVRLLVLFHISARYVGMEHLLVNEARQVMENVIVPIDGQKLELKYES
ncbi:MAG: ribonuclease Z, partial [Thermoprotei archaeon]